MFYSEAAALGMFQQTRPEVELRSEELDGRRDRVFLPATLRHESVLGFLPD
jgi:hypothetical protein